MQSENPESSRGSASATQVSIKSIISDPAALDELSSRGIDTVQEPLVELIEAVLSGSAVQVSGSRAGRNRAFAIALLALRQKDGKDRTVIVADSDQEADRFSRVLQDFGLSYSKLGKRGGNQNKLGSATVLLGTAQGILDAFDQGVVDGSKINRVLIDECEHPIRAGKIEELLNLLHNLPTTQVIVSASEITTGIGNFAKRFLNNPRIVESKAVEGLDDESSPIQRRQSGGREYSNREHTENNAETQSSDEGTDGSSVRESRHSQRAPEPVKIERKLPEGAKHQYFELPNELLAKPNALVDLIESSGSPATVVFCNTPSDADMTDVMLKKRGIATRKLIGFVAPNRIQAAVEALDSKKATALVVTDISARELVLKNVGLVVNYSVHNDPDIYTQRAGVVVEPTTPPTIVSFVTPLDIANFHYLRKLISIEFEKAELPTKEQVSAAKLTALSANARSKGLAKDERLASLCKLVMESEARDDIIALLISNTLDVLPGLQASAERSSGEEGESRRGNDRRGGFSNGRDRRRRGDDFSEGGEQASGAEQPSDDSESRQNFRRGGQNQLRVPPARDVRVYVGHGSQAGVTASTLTDLVVAKAEFPAEHVKRTIVRELYSFVDVPEQLGDLLVAKLDTLEISPGTKTFVRKAVLIPAPRDRNEEQHAEEGQQSETSAGETDSASAAATDAPASNVSA